METATLATRPKAGSTGKMKAAIFVEKGRIVLDDKPIPEIGPMDALMRVTTTTICGTDVHILKGEYPVAKGLTIGHEPVGIIEKLGSEVKGFTEGQRVITGAITPSGWSNACLCGFCCAGRRRDQARLAGDRRLEVRQHHRRLPGRIRPHPGRDGEPRRHRRQPHRRRSADVPRHHVDGLRRRGERRHQDRRHRRGLRPGPDRPLRHRRGQADGRDPDHHRGHRARPHGDVAPRSAPTSSIDFKAQDPVEAIMQATDGRGVDVAIEALGTQATFEAALRVLRPGGVLSSLGVYSGNLTIPLDAFAAGLGEKSIRTALCPGGKERMRRMIEVIGSGRLDLKGLVTHRYTLDRIEEAYELFANQRDGVLKVAISV